jgi:hypothetical protein
VFEKEVVSDMGGGRKWGVERRKVTGPDEMTWASTRALDLQVHSLMALVGAINQRPSEACSFLINWGCTLIDEHGRMMLQLMLMIQTT